jgi:hypothetical protein
LEKEKAKELDMSGNNIMAFHSRVGIQHRHCTLHQPEKKKRAKQGKMHYDMIRYLIWGNLEKFCGFWNEFEAGTRAQLHAYIHTWDWDGYS